MDRRRIGRLWLVVALAAAVSAAGLGSALLAPLAPGVATRREAGEGAASGRLSEATPWDEGESPNYVRLVGPAAVPEDLDPGEVRYSGVDALGRVGRVEARITYEMMSAGSSRERSTSVPDPAGWGHNAKAEVELPDGRLYHGWFWNRSHLLAKSLGGSDGPENLICGTRMQNVGANDGQGGMAMVETACRAWLRDYPDQTILYVATPLYRDGEVIPRSVVVDARSSDGVLDEEVEVYNCAKGYEIDYVTGSFASS
jgi:DNA-entry nuclease